MLRNKNKRVSPLLYGLVLTSFVTACVKNASKNEAPKVVPLKSLSIVQLAPLPETGQNTTQVTITDQASTPANQVVQDYVFESKNIQELSVQRGTINNEDCETQELTLPRFSLIDSDNNEKMLRNNRKPEILTPGHYRLRVAFDNTGLCKNINIGVKISSKARNDLVLTKKTDSGYLCYSSNENGRAKINTSVRVNTLPMKLTQYEEFHGTIQEQKIVDNDVLCSAPLSTKVSCVDKLIPALKKTHPISAISRECQAEEQRYNQGLASLEISKINRSVRMDFTCRHKGKIKKLNLSDCEVIFNLGESLPIVAGRTDILVRNHLMRVNFEPLFNQIDEEQIPQDLYVGLARQVDQSYYEPLLNSFYYVSKNDLIDGQINIREHNLANKVLSADSKDIRLVFSRSPNLKQGLFHLNFSSLCSHSGNAMILKINQGSEKNLCE